VACDFANRSITLSEEMSVSVLSSRRNSFTSRWKLNCSSCQWRRKRVRYIKYYLLQGQGAQMSVWSIFNTTIHCITERHLFLSSVLEWLDISVWLAYSLRFVWRALTSWLFLAMMAAVFKCIFQMHSYIVVHACKLTLASCMIEFFIPWVSVRLSVSGSIVDHCWLWVMIYNAQVAYVNGLITIANHYRKTTHTNSD
jgi:hypothetical protein